MTEKVYPCPAYIPGKSGTSGDICRENGRTGKAITDYCPIGATNCAKITRQQENRVYGFSQKWVRIKNDAIEVQKNLIG